MGGGVGGVNGISLSLLTDLIPNHLLWADV